MKKTEARKQNVTQANYRLLTHSFKMCTFILILHTGTHNKHSVLFICYLTISIYIQKNINNWKAFQSNMQISFSFFFNSSLMKCVGWILHSFVWAKSVLISPFLTWLPVMCSGKNNFKYCSKTHKQASEQQIYVIQIKMNTLMKESFTMSNNVLKLLIVNRRKQLDTPLSLLNIHCTPVLQKSTQT